jgi:hypothetical protein
MKKIGGIESVTIGDQTFNVSDFEDLQPMTFKVTLCKEYWEQYAQQQREKLLKNTKVKFIKVKK